jgi:hypothetical protein
MWSDFINPTKSMAWVVICIRSKARHAMHFQLDVSANALEIKAVQSLKCIIWCAVDCTSCSSEYDSLLNASTRGAILLFCFVITQFIAAQIPVLSLVLLKVSCIVMELIDNNHGFNVALSMQRKTLPEFICNNCL